MPYCWTCDARALSALGLGSCFCTSVTRPALPSGSHTFQTFPSDLRECPWRPLVLWRCGACRISCLRGRSIRGEHLLVCFVFVFDGQMLASSWNQKYVKRCLTFQTSGHHNYRRQILCTVGAAAEARVRTVVALFGVSYRARLLPSVLIKEHLFLFFSKHTKQGAELISPAGIAVLEPGRRPLRLGLVILFLDKCVFCLPWFLTYTPRRCMS